MAIAVAILMVTPFLAAASTNLNSSRIVNTLVLHQYSADSGVEHAIWRLAYEPGLADSLTVDDPTAQYSVAVNDTNVLITVTRQRISAAGSFPIMAGLDYTLEAGHLLEYKITINTNSDDDLWFAYDTTDMSSWVTLPSQTDSLTLYPHNNPTPPIGDTVSQHPLPTDTSAPSAVILYNYDTDRDAFPGRLIQKNLSPSGPDESDPVKYQNWQTLPFTSPFHIYGTVDFGLWVGMKDFERDKTGILNLYLRDYDGASYTEIASTTVTITPQDFQSGDFVHIGTVDFYDIEASTSRLTIRATVRISAGQITVLSWQIE